MRQEERCYRNGALIDLDIGAMKDDLGGVFDDLDVDVDLSRDGEVGRIEDGEEAQVVVARQDGAR